MPRALFSRFWIKNSPFQAPLHVTWIISQNGTVCAQSYKDTLACLWFCLILSFCLYPFLLLRRFPSRTLLELTWSKLRLETPLAQLFWEFSDQQCAPFSFVHVHRRSLFYSNLICIAFSEPARCNFLCILTISRMIGKFRSSLCVPYYLFYLYDEKSLIVYSSLLTKRLAGSCMLHLFDHCSENRMLTPLLHCRVG